MDSIMRLGWPDVPRYCAVERFMIDVRGCLSRVEVDRPRRASHMRRNKHCLARSECSLSLHGSVVVVAYSY